MTINVEGIPITENLTSFTESHSNTSLFISFNYFNNYTVGNPLYLNGTTNLPANDTFTVVVLTMNYYLAEKNTNIYYPNCVINTQIIPSQSGANIWAIDAPDTCLSQLSPDWSPYDVRIRYNDSEFDDMAFPEFNVLPAPNGTELHVQVDVQPTPHVWPAPTSFQNNPSPPQTTTQSASLSVILPIIAIAALWITMKKG